MTFSRLFILALALAAAVGCSRTDQTACQQYADTIEALGCTTDGEVGGGARLVEFCAAGTDPCTDAESDECVALWDCYDSGATCDAAARFEHNNDCQVANDLTLSEDVRYD